MKKKLMIILGLSLLIFSLNARAAWITKRLTYNSTDSEYPDIAIDSNNCIHVVWQNKMSGSDDEIYYKKSTDNGATWTTKRLTDNLGWSEHPHIAVDSNDHLHIVWEDGTPGNREIFHKKSTNSGASWTTRRLTYSAGDSSYPVIATDSYNHLHVVWDDFIAANNQEIFYKRSTDSGATWTTKRLTYNPNNSYLPAIAIASNNYIHIVWADFSSPFDDDEIYYKRSINGGTSWTTKRLTYNASYSRAPDIATDSNNHIHIVWDDLTPGEYEIYYKRSTNSGVSWATKRLTYNPGGSFHPAIAVDSNNYIHVVWNDSTPINDDEIYYKKSTDGGTTWITERLTFNSSLSQSAAIAVDSNDNLYVVWQDYSPGNWEIFYKRKIIFIIP